MIEYTNRELAELHQVGTFCARLCGAVPSRDGPSRTASWVGSWDQTVPGWVELGQGASSQVEQGPPGWGEAGLSCSAPVLRDGGFVSAASLDYAVVVFPPSVAKQCGQRIAEHICWHTGLNAGRLVTVDEPYELRLPVADHPPSSSTVGPGFTRCNGDRQNGVGISEEGRDLIYRELSF